MKNAYIREKNMKSSSTNCNRVSEFSQMYFEDMRKRNYSGKTINSYEKSLKRFDCFLELNGISSVLDATSTLLEKFRASSLKDGLSTGTVALMTRVVKNFFTYLEGEGIIFENPARNLKAPSVEKKMGYVPGERDMRKLLSRPDPATFTGIRDRAILEVAYSTGVRLEELVGMKLSCIDLKNRALRIFGKGRKERTVPLTGKAGEWLEKYIARARRELLKENIDEERLWIDRCGKAMTGNALQGMLVRYSKEAGIRRISPHAVRRACATHMLRNGAHPVQIQMLLGHADLSTLSRYVNITLEEMKKTHAKSRAGK
jgi:site-specific recombinase XerD